MYVWSESGLLQICMSSLFNKIIRIQMKLKHVHSVSQLHMLTVGYWCTEYIKTGIGFVWAAVCMYSY